jgi:dihydrofolate reductase
MKTAIFMAISTNGYITKGETDSDWVNDWDTFSNKITQYGCVLMGRKTYDASSEVFPFPNAKNYVLTSTPSNFPKHNSSEFISTSPSQTIDLLQSNGHNQVLIIGGQYTVTKFLQANLVDEIYLDVHPLIIGQGKTIFSVMEKFNKELKFLDSQVSSMGIITLHYQINQK